MVSFGVLSRLIINRKELRGHPVFVPLVNRNSLESSFPQITWKCDSWYMSAINKQYSFSMLLCNRFHMYIHMYIDT